jgi:hypothetical protein
MELVHCQLHSYKINTKSRLGVIILIFDGLGLRNLRFVDENKLLQIPRITSGKYPLSAHLFFNFIRAFT